MGGTKARSRLSSFPFPLHSMVIASAVIVVISMLVVVVVVIVVIIIIKEEEEEESLLSIPLSEVVVAMKSEGCFDGGVSGGGGCKKKWMHWRCRRRQRIGKNASAALASVVAAAALVGEGKIGGSENEVNLPAYFKYLRYFSKGISPAMENLK